MNEADGQAYKEWIASVFGRGAHKYSQVGPQFFPYFGQKLVDYSGIQAGATVLDVACGRGACLFPACERVGSYGRVMGIDLSAEMVNETHKEIKRRRIDWAEVIEMDAEHLQFDDGIFDFALCGLALFFFPDFDRALSEIFRVLKPQGVLTVSTFGKDDPRWDGFGEIIDGYRERLAPAPKIDMRQLSKPEDVIEAFGNAGFTNIEVFSENKVIHYRDLNQWWETLWSHGFRTFLERLDEASLDTFKEEAFAWADGLLSEEGLPEIWQLWITRARR